jgi:hypothetical protein
VPFLVAQSFFLALAIYLDEHDSPVFARWVALFNVASRSRAFGAGPLPALPPRKPRGRAVAEVTS